MRHAFAGDAEGANEMTYSMGYLRQFCRSFQQNAAATRIFFPDKKVTCQLPCKEGGGIIRLCHAEHVAKFGYDVHMCMPALHQLPPLGKEKRRG